MSRPFALCQEKTPNLVVEPKEIARPNTKTAFNERAKSKSGKQNTKTPIIENVIFCDIPRLYGGICEFWMASKILQPPPPWPPSPPRTHLPWCQHPPGHRNRSKMHPKSCIQWFNVFGCIRIVANDVDDSMSKLPSLHCGLVVQDLSLVDQLLLICWHPKIQSTWIHESTKDIHLQDCVRDMIRESMDCYCYKTLPRTRVEYTISLRVLASW